MFLYFVYSIHIKAFYATWKKILHIYVVVMQFW